MLRNVLFTVYMYHYMAAILNFSIRFFNNNIFPKGYKKQQHYNSMPVTKDICQLLTRLTPI